MTLKEAAQLTGMPEPRILELAKDLQVGFTRNADGVLFVDAESLEAHVPEAPNAPTEDDAGEWLRERDARVLVGITYSVASWWARTSGDYERKKIDGKWHYPRTWCEEQRIARSNSDGRFCQPEKRAPKANRRTLGPSLTPEATRHLRRQLRDFLSAHPGTAMGALSLAAGVYKSAVAEVLRPGGHITCRAETAALLRKTMREWGGRGEAKPGDDAPTEPVAADEDFDMTMAEAAAFLGMTYYYARKYIPKVDCTALRKKYVDIGPGYRLAVSAQWLTKHKSQVLALKQADDDARSASESAAAEHRARITAMAKTRCEPGPAPAPAESREDGFLARILRWAKRRT
jgi:hypothetical protein